MVGSVQSGVRDSCDEVNKILLISSKKEDCELVIGLPFALLALFFSLMQKTKQVLANMKRVFDLNNLNCKVMGLTWGMWDATIFSIHQKVILGADVLYDTSGFDDLSAIVTFLLQNSPGSVFITTYHNRSGHYLIEFLMAK
ncbi:hypothetical protein ACSBR2_024136 [Camellia fascicularis]